MNLLTRKYAPETVIEIVDDFIKAIYSLEKVARMDIDLQKLRDLVFGKIAGRATPFTKAQRKRIYVERDFEIQSYINTLNIVNLINVEEFEVNLPGEHLSKPTPFDLHAKYDAPHEKAIHNLLCQYQAAKLIALLASILDQYLYAYINVKDYKFEDFMPESQYTELLYVINSAKVTQEFVISRLAELSMFTDYKRELVKHVVATKFLYLTKENKEHHFVQMSLDNYINHENAGGYTSQDHGKKIRAHVLSQLTF